MLTTIGIILLFFALVATIWKHLKSEFDERDREIRAANDGRKPRNMTSFPLPLNPMLLTILGIFIIALNGMFFWANAGTAYAVQYPWGGDKMVKTQGLKTKFYGRTIPISYEISIQDRILKMDRDGAYEELAEGQDGIYNRPAHQWEFADAIKADIGTAIVIGIEVDDEKTFLNMADRNRSESKLIYGRVIPNIDAALKNTCKLMDAQEYISGKASDFDRYFRDQLENGMYIVEQYVAEDRIPEIIGDTLTIRTVGNVNNNKQTKYRIKRDEQGDVVRDNKSNTLTQYGIHIYQAQVTGIDWESTFDERLQLQKEQVAQTQLEKQEAEKEFYRAKKEIAKGESDKAAERAKLEKEQIKLTISAETRAKVAEQNLIVEKRQYEVEQFKAKSKKVAADAQYYENAKLVSAGLTPQEQAELELKKVEVISANFSQMSTPGLVINGGSDGGDITNSLIQAAMAKQLMNDK